MIFKKNDVLEPLVSHSRSSLWLALAIILVLGAVAVSTAIYPGINVIPFAGLFPVAIAIAAGALRARGGKLAAEHPDVMKNIREDELRQQSQGRAYRNALLAVLVVQPLLAFALTSSVVSYPLALMATVTVIAGAAVFLASLLFYDR